MPVIPTTQEAEVRRVVVRSQSGQIIHKTISKKTHHKKKEGGLLVGWLKVKALSSNLSITKKKKSLINPPACLTVPPLLSSSLPISPENNLENLNLPLPDTA
jgi:hypothetical protein